MKKWIPFVLVFCILVSLDIWSMGNIRASGAENKEIVSETEENVESLTTEINDTEFFNTEDIGLSEILQEEELFRAENGLINGDYQYQILENGTVEITRYIGSDGNVEIPSRINGKLVTSIGDAAFYDCDCIISLVIPESVSSIGGASFEFCDRITHLTIPGSVTDIGNHAFLYCTGIVSLTISEGVKNIGYGAFEGCSGISCLVIPESVIKIEDETFYGCYGLNRIIVKEGNINYDSRDNCNAIIETYSNKLILGCENTKIPESVTEIEGLAFSGCKGLSSLRISKNVTKVSGFGGCTGLNQIVVEEGNPVYDSRDNCNAIIETETNQLVVGCKNTRIPKGVTSIGGGAFVTHDNITKMIIPDGVTTIKTMAFANCTGLTSLVMPDSLKNIESLAFLYCDKLTIYCSENSYAHTYAIEEKIPYKLISSAMEKQYFAGTLESVDVLGCTMVIDGQQYAASDDFAINIPGDILLNSGSKKVIYTMSYGCVTNMEKLEDCIEPKVSFFGCTGFRYKDGEFAENVNGMQVIFSCNLKSPYNNIKLDGIGTQVEKFKLTIPEYGINFGKSGLINKKSILEKEEKINKFLSLGETLCFDYNVFLEENYVPPVVAKAELPINGIAIIDGTEIEFKGSMPIINADYQRQIAEKKKAKRKLQTSISTAQKELEKLCNGYTLTLSSDFSYYLDNSQIQQIRKYLYVWLAEVNNANVFTDDKEINKKIMGKLGINPNAGFIWKTGKAVTQVKIRTVYGEKTFKFVLSLGTLQSNGTAYGSFGDINYEVIEKDGIPNTIPTEGLLAVATYASMNQFIKCVQEVAESSIKEAYQGLWGDHANEIVSLIVDKTILQMIDAKYGSFSNGVYTIFSAPTKSYIKKVKVECPVDVFIYDMDGELCGKIVNNVVDEKYSDIAMYVENDTKVFYLTGDDYQIKLVGNDAGTMTYTIEEFGNQMESLRTVQFVDLPLEGRKLYEGYVMEQPYLDNSLYALATENGNRIMADLDTYLDHSISRVYVSGIELDVSKKTMSVGESFHLNASILPSDATNQKVIWNSSDASIVTVNDVGNITAVQEGTVIISASSDDGGFEAICQVTVLPVENQNAVDNQQIKVKKLSISGISKKIAAGKKVSLKVTVSPKNASNSKVKWKTSNKKYATVNSKGVVTTKKAGKGKTVTITATAADGSKVKASYKIKLMKHQVKKVKISNAKKMLKAGKTIQLKGKVTANGKNANKTLKWSTSNKKYATVNSKGKVTAKKAGKGKTVTITAQSTDGTNKKAKIKIKIK